VSAYLLDASVFVACFGAMLGALASLFWAFTGVVMLLERYGDRDVPHGIRGVAGGLVGMVVGFATVAWLVDVGAARGMW